MIRVDGLVVISQVAAATRGRRAFKRSTHVALRAGSGGMFAGERKLCQCIVIEFGSQPRSAGVAGCTVMRESGGDVIGIGGAREIGRVAAEAIRGDALEFVSNVATRARKSLMRSNQRESGEPVVIEFRSQPCVHAVAVPAIGGQSCGFMIQAGRPVVIGQMATGAISREARIHATRRALVAAFASRCRMCPEQRKAIPMVLRCTRVGTPSLHRMAAFALRPELAAVDIGMAVRAPSAGLRKNF